MDYDVIIVGAGISGLYQLHEARRLGLKAHILEAQSDVGGTWQANRYPGCRFDSESYSYGYSFSRAILQSWTWSELFASQPETLRYLRHVADRLDLRRDITFDAQVTRALWNERHGQWCVTVDTGEQMGARFLITAIGILSAPVTPSLPGRDSFAGRQFHTADWPRDDFDLAGKRVAVIGTGSTGIQVIQETAKVAAHLTVFQREASWCKPLRNRPITQGEMDRIKASYDEIFHACRTSFAAFVHKSDPRTTFEVSEEERARLYSERYDLPGFAFNQGNFHDIATEPLAAQAVGDFLADKIRRRVRDPRTAEMLIPQDHLFATRRVAMETDYFEVYNQTNVELIDVNATPITRLTASGVAVGGREIPVDVIIYATGFDAIRGAFDRIDIRGVGGRRLADKWAEGPVTYMGLAGSDFPNMLTLVGPQSSGTFCNVPRCAEQNVEFATGLLTLMQREGYDTVEATPEAERGWMDWLVEAAAPLLAARTDSWFTGVNVNLPGRQARQMLIYPGSQPAFAAFCDRVVAAGYEGFTLARNPDRQAA